MSDDVKAVQRAIRDGRSCFKSNKQHADFAGGVAETLSHEHDGIFEGKAFVLGCMPPAWVGTTKEAAWERMARRVTSSS